MSEGRHRATPQRLHPAVIVAAVVVVAGLGVGAFLLLRDGADGSGGFFGGGPDNTIPEFDFTVGQATAISTTNPESKELAAAAETAADQVVEPMTALYVEAFLDPANWREGTYDEVWALFEKEAATSAQEDMEILTLGTQAIDAYEKVEPVKGKLSFRVLLDDEGNPATIVVVVRFVANAEAEGGDVIAIVSTGQYFLRDTGDGWKVYSYDITREDHAKAPSPAPAASPSEVAS
ncbi:MAG: hypothetical protein ACT4PO_13150 [Actinomycetota bacterium]